MSATLNRAGSFRPPTPRQLEVAAAIVRCGSRAEAARDLNIGLQTVKNHGFYGVLVLLGWLTSPDVER